MKNKIFMLSMASLAVIACDPILDEEDWSYTNLSQAEVDADDFVTIIQKDAKGNEASDGNYITFSAKNNVMVYVKDANGNKSQKACGSGGTFTLTKARGEEPDVDLYFDIMNGEDFITTKRSIKVSVPQQLAPELRMLCSENGKRWTWGTDASGRCWGNAGNSGGVWDGSAIWWGTAPIGDPLTGKNEDGSDNNFIKQLQHSKVGTLTGEENYGAYMMFYENGTVIKYDNEGNKLHEGKYELNDYNPKAEDWIVAKLITKDTDNGDILWPYMINGKGKVVTEYNVSQITPEELTLTYYETEVGGWGETTWWRFVSTTDTYYSLSNNSAKKWTWGTDESGRCWGNGGNSGGVWDGSQIWWGTAPIGDPLTGKNEDGSDNNFAKQMNHSGSGNEDETKFGAYMTFDCTSGKMYVTKYTPEGEEIIKSEVTLTDPDYSTWAYYGTLSVEPNSAGNDNPILFPFMINGKGKLVNTFNISAASANSLVLTYYETEVGGWGETTWWSFKPLEE
jgi:hypothetical protein